MPDDDFIDLMKAPKGAESVSVESDSGEPDSEGDQRDSLSAFIVGVGACFAPIGVVVFTLKNLPGGIQIAAIVAYTLTIPYILSNRYLSYVPWDLLNRFRKKFLLAHCLAMAVICGITTLAFAARPSLPDWFITSGRRPALFYYCLGGVLLALALWESSWISKHKSGQGFDKDKSGPRLPRLT
jgi:hypothetical protein